MLAAPDNFAYIIYTSGTTGQPKGVVIHQAGMTNHILAKINDLAITRRDMIAQTASASFDISVWQFLAGSLVGACIVIFDKETILESKKFLKLLQQEKITILESVPSLMSVFLETTKQEKDNKLKHLRWMIPTGETLPVSLVRKWYERYPDIKLLNAYGPTEASDDVTHYIINEIHPGNKQPYPLANRCQIFISIYWMRNYLYVPSG
jgi:non-ribosomal peptide synthetase component F